jgi:putative component of membrane protein insertase Oxa1/YidC/SpoIIIJ protein YidD
MQRIPTEWEQDVAAIYVNKRQLVRPDTNIKKALLFTAIFVLVTGIFVWLIHYVLITAGIAAYLPSGIQEFYGAYRFLSIVIVCALVVIIESFFCLKYAVIGMVKLYQHYAPEEIRRRCLFMPTCSEYTIMAVRKYGCFIGLCKSYYRLVYRCDGVLYQIDYP